MVNARHIRALGGGPSCARRLSRADTIVEVGLSTILETIQSLVARRLQDIFKLLIIQRISSETTEMYALSDLR